MSFICTNYKVTPTLQLEIQLFSHSSLICSKAFGLYYLQNFGVVTTISTRTGVHMSMLHYNFTRLDHQTSLLYVQCLHIKTMPLQIWRTPLLTFHVHNRTNGIQHIATLMKFPICKTCTTCTCCIFAFPIKADFSQSFCPSPVQIANMTRKFFGTRPENQ